MFQIECPHCGKREMGEFSYGGEANLARPAPEKADDIVDWAGYLFLRSNKRGIHIERWFHVFGCRKWFNVARHTITNEIFDTSLLGETLRIDVSVKP